MDPLLKAADGLNGLWLSDFGVMEISGQGDRITGTYMGGEGLLEGELAQDRLRLSWKDPVSGQGWGEFALRIDPLRVEGVWGIPSSTEARGSWNAIPLPEVAALGEPTRWLVRGEARQSDALFRGQGLLFRKGASCSGYLDGLYTVGIYDRQENRVAVVNRLSGQAQGDRLALTWTGPLGGGGTLFLLKDGPVLEGIVRTEGETADASLVWIAQEAETVGKPDQWKRWEDSWHARRYFVLGWEASAEDRPGEAQARYRAAIQSFDESGEWKYWAAACIGLADTHLVQGSYEEARRGYAAVESKPEVHPEVKLSARVGLTLVGSALGLDGDPLADDKSALGGVDPDLPWPVFPSGAVGTELERNTYRLLVERAQPTLEQYRRPPNKPPSAAASTNRSINHANLAGWVGVLHLRLDQPRSALSPSRRAAPYGSP